MTLIILLAGVGIGVVVLEGSRRAAEIDQSVSAYYMSDAGIERQLYEIRKNNQTVDYAGHLGTTYPNGSKWVSTGVLEPTQSKSFTTVSTSSFAVLDLFDPDNISTPPGIKTVVLRWDNDPACGMPARVEVSYAYWFISGGVPQFPTDFVVLPKDISRNLTVTLDPSQFYRIRIKAYDCPAKNTVVTFFDNGGAPKPYPGDITLSAEGTYQKATQKIAVTMPKLDVLSGVFGYVIFSECQLLKGTGSPTCPP